MFLMLARPLVSCYTHPMTITQTVDIPASHRLTIDVPREIPEGRAVLAFTAASGASEDEDDEDATEYLMRSPANRAHLLQAIKNVEEGKIISFDTPEQAIQCAREMAAKL